MVLNLELEPFFTSTILRKRDREGNIEVGVLSDTDVIQQQTPLPPQQNISVAHPDGMQNIGLPQGHITGQFKEALECFCGQ